MTSPIPDNARANACDLLDFIAASPSPWHVVASAVARLTAAGYTALDERERWQLSPGDKRFVVRAGSSIVAFELGSEALAEHGWRLIGAHTDSPGLRLKPKAAHLADGLLRLGVEVYGGPILATFADRDLGLAGRLIVRDASAPQGVSSRLLHINTPIARLPNLAIHMNREVNEAGLKLHKQNELPLLIAMGSDFINTPDAADWGCCVSARVSSVMICSAGICSRAIRKRRAFGGQTMSSSPARSWTIWPRAMRLYPRCVRIRRPSAA
jgi:aspartyl aminopeptidase